MTNHEIKQFLVEQGVVRLYHTNTVETSLSFFRSGGLLSRGLCTDMRLPQTAQYTDSLDRDYNIFYDIFFDSVEIQRITGVSYYGPVLFVYNIDVLDTIDEGHIRITKINPEKWRRTRNESERYFTTLEELTESYNSRDFGQHITLTNQRVPLSFNHLEKVVLSNPRQNNNELFEIARDTIQNVPEIRNNRISFEIRNYQYNDRFFDTYRDADKLKVHFAIGRPAVKSQQTKAPKIKRQVWQD